MHLKLIGLNCYLGSNVLWIFSGVTSDGYLCADGQPTGSKDYEEHQYVNTQSLENLDSFAQGLDGHRGARAPDSPKKDLFDMSESRDHMLTQKNKNDQS